MVGKLMPSGQSKLRYLGSTQLLSLNAKFRYLTFSTSQQIYGNEHLEALIGHNSSNYFMERKIYEKYWNFPIAYVSKCRMRVQ